MKILIIPSKYLPAIGGLERAVSAISRELIKRGHEIFMITNRHARQLAPYEEIEGIPVRRYYFTDRCPKSGHVWIWFKWLIRLLMAPVSFVCLIYNIKKFRPDIVHLHYAGSPTLYVLAAKLFLRFPLIVSLHGSDIAGFHEKSSLQKRILTLTLKYADFLTSNAQVLLEEAVTGTKITPKESSVVEMGFSPEFYDQAKPHFHTQPYLFAAGRFIWEKGFDVLIEAYSELIKKKRYAGNLLIAGEGPEAQRYRNLCRELDLEKDVIFLGMLDSARMASYMKGCDLCVIPSRREAFGIITLEALYAGRRVVASRVGGIPGLMHENPQQLVLPNDPGELSSQIEKTLSGECAWKSVDQEMLKKKYSWNRVASDYSEIYEKIIRRKHDTP